MSLANSVRHYTTQRFPIYIKFTTYYAVMHCLYEQSALYCTVLRTVGNMTHLGHSRSCSKFIPLPRFEADQVFRSTLSASLIVGAQMGIKPTLRECLSNSWTARTHRSGGSTADLFPQFISYVLQRALKDLIPSFVAAAMFALFQAANMFVTFLGPKDG